MNNCDVTSGWILIFIFSYFLIGFYLIFDFFCKNPFTNDKINGGSVKPPLPSEVVKNTFVLLGLTYTKPFKNIS